MENRKVVLVTGSARGLGSYIIRSFAKNNYNVIINYNNSVAKANALKEEIIKNYNVDVLLIKADISKECDIKRMYEESISKFGKVDILVNNAAICCDNYIDNKTKEEFMKVLEVNVVGQFLVTKYFSKSVDLIINISSTDSVDTYNELNIDYSASKAALNSITKTFALAIPSIKIFAILLPFINTDSVKEMNQEFLKNELKRTNQNRLYEPLEISDKIVKLSSSDIKSGDIIRWGDIYDK
ncbi:MAG: SDR family NAD(P)-dependent oxidoreductase [Clostridium sp.]|nr:SDR family NAD(P)-dependent oxidoreductase [Clostridium sp.]MCM1444753.1 SDR family NAD(P)-dependent oxidoreductase [Candidatus Amulumruptor caecigallinarius]